VFATWVATATTMFREDGMSPTAADEFATTVVAAIGGAFTLARTARDANLMRATGRSMTALVAAATTKAIIPP
jgi:hypothetical protein